MGKATYRDAGVDLEVREGEILGLIGPNGSGKTTLFDCVTGIQRPTDGDVYFMGRRITRLKPHTVYKLGVGRTFQLVQLFPGMTVLDNMIMAIQESEGTLLSRLFKIDESDDVRKAIELLEQVGLSDRWHHRPEELSGGEKQRVAVARALATPAELILADEPTGNLDSKTSIQVVEILRQLAHQENRAVLVVTHDESLRALADKIIHLKDGVLVNGGA